MKHPHEYILEIFQGFKRYFSPNQPKIPEVSISNQTNPFLLFRDNDCAFNQNLVSFLQQEIFPNSLSGFYSLTLSFAPGYLPKSLVQAQTLLNSFLNKIQPERFYSVIEGDFANPAATRPNIHLLFTLPTNSFSHPNCFVRSGLYCPPCKLHYLKLWTNGTIFLRYLGSDLNHRRDLFRYVSKIDKSVRRFSVKIPNFPLIIDYLSRLNFSVPWHNIYQQRFFVLFKQKFSPVLVKSSLPAAQLSPKPLFAKKSSRKDYWRKYSRRNKIHYNLLKLKSKLKKKISANPESKLIDKWKQKLIETERLLI